MSPDASGGALSQSPGGAVDATALLQADPELVDCALGEGLALLDPRSGACFRLNRTGALLWTHARQPVTRNALVASLHASCPDAPATLAEDVDRLLVQLIAAGLFRVSERAAEPAIAA